MHYEVIFVEYVSINQQNRRQINAFISERWLSTDMIIRGKRIDMNKSDGIAAVENGGIIGLVTYAVRGGICEITSLDSLKEGRGIGTALINRVIRIAKESGCRRIIVVTTNDNINAIRFYQKRGFDMARFYRNALDISRKMKPGIPLIGDNGIPLRHEIEFELDLT